MLAVFSFFLIRPFLFAIFFGLLLGYIVYPLYERLQRKVHNRTIAALLLCVLVLVVIIVPTAFFIKVLVQQSLVAYIAAKQTLAKGVFENCANQFCQAIQEFGRDPIIANKVQDMIKTVTNWVIEKGSSFLFRVPLLLLNFFVVMFTLFYTLKDGEQLLDRANVYLNLHQRKYVIIRSRLKEIIHGVVYGYLFVALIQGIFGAIGFWLFGISSPIFWGTVMAFLALIPYLGTGFVWIPASLFIVLEGAFQNSNGLIVKGVGLFLYSLVFVSWSDNLLRPRLISRKARVHPFVILIGTLGGVLVLGPPGVIIGPLLLSLMQVIIDVYLLKETGFSESKL